jgi:hypothetical protein
MAYQSQVRRSESKLNAVQDELTVKSSPLRLSQMFPASAFARKEDSYFASRITTQLAAVQIIAAQQRQRQTILQLLALQQFQGNLLPHGPRFTSPNSPAQQHCTATSIKVDGSDLLGAAVALKRATPRPSIITTTSKNDIPRSSDSEHSAETIDSTDTSSFDEDLEESRGKASRKYIDIVDENDVLCGRGGRSNHHIGNKRYRQVVAQMKNAYHVCPAKTLKTDLSQAIVNHCCSYGARFVKLDEASGRYYILSRAEARKKTSQALRESKALKWTA